MLDWGEMRNDATPFRFKNMWLREKGFKDLLKGRWIGYNFEGAYNFILAVKLEVLKFDLKIWNKEVFSYVSIRKEMTFSEMGF